MKNSAYRSRVIDLQQYFAARQEQNVICPRQRERAVRFWSITERVVNSVAALVIAGCLGICTLVFLTLL
ncbi:MAG: hypothetical protein IJT18_02200 [Oscillospiraceae bacterium]|nr:hypothetical protein [Oscillospiraceae bacterium]